jgi:general secretion pathway protein L
MEELRIFWLWWRDQLLELLPGHAERRLSRASDGLILSEPNGTPDEAYADGSIAVSERRNGIELPMARVRMQAGSLEQIRSIAGRAHLPVVMRLPDSLLLERDVILPLAAERDLGRVLFHEMDRFTPFAAAEVLWTYTLLFRDRAQGRLTVRLSFVQKALAAPLIESLARAGMPAGCLELQAPGGEPRRISLDRGPNANGVGDRLVGPALAAIGLLLIVAIAIPFILQGRARAEVERRILATTPVVAEVRRLRAAAAEGATGSEVVAAERRRAGDALEAIALLTDALPDDTYLTSLTYDAGKLTLDGQSKSAAALIAPLTANRQLQDASFTAPVVRNTLGLDSFSMRVGVSH